MSNDNWQDLGVVDNVFTDGDIKGMVIDGQKIGLFRVGDDVYALDDLCTHGNALLSEGALEQCEIECPLHGGAFDVRTGKALCAPLSRDAKCHQIQIIDGRLMLRLNR